MPIPRKRRHPLMEEILKELLTLLAESEADVEALRVLAQDPTADARVAAGARFHIDRYEALGADPDRWIPSHLDSSIDMIAAMSRFKTTDPAALLSPDDKIPMARQLRRQAYWAWMRNDLERLREGCKVHAPFQCEVAPRHIGQRNDFKLSTQDAAEFYQLVHFLPAYYQTRGRILSFVRKGTPMHRGGPREPDFIVEDRATGEELGLEMTDAVGGLRAARSRFFWEIAADLDERLGDFEGTVLVYDRQYDRPGDIVWEGIAKHHRESFLRQILDRVEASTRGKFRVSVAEKDGYKEILVDFQRKKGVRFIMQGDQYGWSGDNPERIATGNLVECLRNKIDATEPYSTARTLLVIYPLSEGGLMGYDRVLRLAADVLPDVLRNNARFDEIWVNKERNLWPLHPGGTVHDEVSNLAG